jgi:hypothetical protein
MSRWQGFSGLAVLFVGVGVSVDALGYGPGDNRSPAVQTLAQCLERMYPVGAYLSTDGGRSAKRLLSKCVGEGNAVSKECQINTGGTSQDCDLKTAKIVQEFIRQRERELK